MKKFVIKGFVFILIYFCFSEVANQVYIELILSYSNLYRMEAQFEEKREEVDILFVGDSHPAFAVDPRIIPSSFVWASGNETIIHTYYHLKYFLEKGMINPRLVVIPLDLHSLSSYQTDRLNDVSFWRKYINYLELARNKHDLFNIMRQRVGGEFIYTGGIEDTVDLFSILYQRVGLTPMIDGHRLALADERLADNPGIRAERRARQQFDGQDPIDPDLLRYFIMTLEMLRDYDIDVIFVRYPVSKQYYQKANQIIDSRAVYDEIEDTLEQYDFNYAVYDFHDTYWGQNKLFKDIDHVSRAGSEVFSNALYEDLARDGYFP